MRHLLNTTSRLVPLFLVLLLLIPITFAQNDIMALDVTIETDPFTDEIACAQMIGEWDEDDVPVFFMMPSFGTGTTGITISFGFPRELRNLVYDEVADPDQDRVLIRIGDEIYTLPIGDTAYLRDRDIEVAMALRTGDVLRALANAKQPVPVRFESDYSGTQVIQRRVTPLSIVEDLYEREDRCAKLIRRLPRTTIEQLDLKSREKAFHCSVIETISDAAHGTEQPSGLETLPELQAGVATTG